MRAFFLFLCVASCSKTPIDVPAPAPAQASAPAPAQTPPDLLSPDGKWVEEIVPSKMNDSVISSLTLKAEDEIEVFTGAKVFPKLVVSCGSGPQFTGGLLTLGVVTGFPVATETKKGQPDGAEIAIRLDAGEIVTDRWFSTEDKLMLMTPATVPMVISIAKSETMRIEFKPLKSNPVVARFDTRGMRSHLNLLAACDKKP